MPDVFTIVDECLHILTGSDLPRENIAPIEKEVHQIRALLIDDPFNATRCNFFAMGQFEDLLHRVRAASQEPIDVEAIAKVADHTGEILLLLEGNLGATT